MFPKKWKPTTNQPFSNNEPTKSLPTKNGWLEYYLPIGFRPIFRGELVVSGRVKVPGPQKNTTNQPTNRQRTPTEAGECCLGHCRFHCYFGEVSRVDQRPPLSHRWRWKLQGLMLLFFLLVGWEFESVPRHGVRYRGFRHICM